MRSFQDQKEHLQDYRLTLYIHESMDLNARHHTIFYELEIGGFKGSSKQKIAPWLFEGLNFNTPW